MNRLSLELEQNIEKIKSELKGIDTELNSTLSVRFELSSERLLTQVSFEYLDGDQMFRSARKANTWINVGLGSVLGTAALFVMGGAVPMTLMAIGTGIASFFNYKPEPVVLRKKIVEERLNNFDKSKDKMLEQIVNQVFLNFDTLEVGAEDLYRSAIRLLSSLLKARENDIKKSEESRFIENSHLENQVSILKEMQNNLLYKR